MNKNAKNMKTATLGKRIMTGFFSIVIGMSGTLAISALASSFYDVNIIETDENGNAQVQNVATNLTEVDEIISTNGIKVNEHDWVDLTNFKTREDSHIIIYRSCNITLDLGNETIQIPTAVGTIAHTLEENSIDLGEDDELSHPEDTIVEEGMEITVHRAFTVTIDDNGEETEIEFAKGTVRDALEKAGIELDEDDTASPSLDTEITDEIKIKLYRTEFVTKTENEVIKFKNKTVRDKTKKSGTKEITQEGKNGELKITTTEKFVNGKLVDTQTTKEVIKKPVNRVTTVGTYVEPITLKNGTKTVSSLALPKGITIDENGIPTDYIGTMDAKATAYSCGTHTATGKEVRTGYVAVNPKVIPYGTKMWIVSLDGNYVYGYASAEDTGGFVHNGSGVDVDLFFNTESECYNFGVRGVRIYFLPC